jgi:large subunit ribosomal protein L30e
MAPKKTKTSDSINSRLALVMKSGKVTLGYKSTLKVSSHPSYTCSFLLPYSHSFPAQVIRSGKAKLIIIAGNTPPLRKSELEYYAMLGKTAVHHFNGNNVSRHTLALRRSLGGVLGCSRKLVQHQPWSSFPKKAKQSNRARLPLRALESRTRANLFLSHRSSLVPLPESCSVALPWPSSMPVTPTSSLPLSLKCEESVVQKNTIEECQFDTPTKVLVHSCTLFRLSILCLCCIPFVLRVLCAPSQKCMIEYCE